MHWLEKLAVALAVMAGCFFVGRFSRKPEIQTKTQVVEKEHVVTKVVTVTEKAPDGTATTTTTTSTTSDTTTATDSKHPVQPVAGGSSANRPRYMAQVNFTPRLDADAYKPTGIELGRRLGDTNMFGVIGHDWKRHETTLGLRVDF